MVSFTVSKCKVLKHWNYDAINLIRNYIGYGFINAILVRFNFFLTLKKCLIKFYKKLKTINMKWFTKYSEDISWFLTLYLIVDNIVFFYMYTYEFIVCIMHCIYNGRPLFLFLFLIFHDITRSAGHRWRETGAAARIPTPFNFKYITFFLNENGTIIFFLSPLYL